MISMKNPIKKLWNDLWAKWQAETPLFAKWVRNTAGTIAGAVPAAWITFQTTGITLPQWFVNTAGYIMFASIIITGIAGTRSKKGGKDEAT